MSVNGTADYKYLIREERSVQAQAYVEVLGKSGSWDTRMVRVSKDHENMTNEMSIRIARYTWQRYMNGKYIYNLTLSMCGNCG